MITAALIVAVSAMAGCALVVARPTRRLRELVGSAGRRHADSDSVRPDIAPDTASSAGASGRPADDDDVPLLLELLGAMLQAGLSLQRALAIAARIPGPASRPLGRAAAALDLGAAWEHAWPAVPGALRTSGDELRDALDFAACTGAPSAELLFSRAGQIRRRRHRELERRAAALGVRLVVPLGVCSLPAFLCLGVVPVLLAMLPAG